MSTDKPDIGIIYSKGSFKDSELEALAKDRKSTRLNSSH